MNAKPVSGYTATLASRATVAVLTLCRTSKVVRWGSGFVLIAASAAVLVALVLTMTANGSHLVVSAITGAIIAVVFQLLADVLGRSRRSNHKQ